MPDPDRTSCALIRQSLADLAMALEDRPPERKVALHLDGCPACRAFAADLGTARTAFRRAAVYGPALRQRTLAAVARTPAGSRPSQWWLLPPAVVLGLVFSFVVPLWLADQLLRPFLGASPLTVALGLAAVVSQTVLAGAALYLAVSLERRPSTVRMSPALEV